MPVARIGQDKAALAAAGMRPIFLSDNAAIGAARDADVRVVLLRAVDVIRKSVIDRDVVELRRRLIASVVQVLPPSIEMLAPPSFALPMRCGFCGSIQSP